MISGAQFATRTQLRADNPAGVSQPRLDDPFTVVKSAVNELSAGFASADRKLGDLTRGLPADAKRLIEAQLLMSRVHLQSEVLTRVIDGAGAALRRLQQTAAG